MKTLRVAVCLSGELRTWEFCKESIRLFFEKGSIVDFPRNFTQVPANIKVDYFTHTWTTDRAYFTNARRSWLHDSTDVVNEDSINKMVQWLKPKKHLHQPKRNRITNNEIGTFLDLFQSFYSSIQLKRQYELENNFEYDIVVKCRYDLLFSSVYSPPSNMCYPDRIYDNTLYNDSDIWFTNEANRLNIQDVFFYGSSFSMDKVANIYANEMTRRLHTPHEFGRSEIRNKFNTKSYIRNDVHSGVWLDPGPTTGGPGVALNDFMHKTYIGNRMSYGPFHGEHRLFNNYIIVRPFTTCFNPSDANDRAKMRSVAAKIHYTNFRNPLAIIFDLDGVLVSTNILHHTSMCRAVKDCYGIDIESLESVSADSMLSTREKLSIIKDTYNLPVDSIDILLKYKDVVFTEEVKSIVVLPNVLDCLRKLKLRGIKTAIASNSRRINIENVVAAAGLAECFDIIVSADEVPRRKPMPDILFEVYNRLGISYDSAVKTLFVEDTDEGAAAGFRSPSTVIRINSPEEVSIDLFKEWL